MSDVDFSWVNSMTDIDRQRFLARVEASDMGAAEKQWYRDAVETVRQQQMATVDLSWINSMSEFDRNSLMQRLQADQARQQATGSTPAQQANAFDTLKKNLESFGLGALADRAWQFMVAAGQPSADTVWNWIYDQKEFHDRFPAFKALQEKNRAITPDEYIQLEKYYAQVMRASGVPPTFFDNPSDFTQLIANEVSPQEFQQRVENGYRRVSQMNPEVRKSFSRYFGVDGDAALAAFFIDPAKAAPALVRMVQAAEISGAIAQQDVNINLDYASRLVSAGVTAEQASEAARRLVSQRGLVQAGVNETQLRSVTDMAGRNAPMELDESSMGYPTSIPKSSTAGIVGEEAAALGAFAGVDAATEAALEQRRRQRVAQGQGERTQTVVSRTGRTSLG